MSWLKPFLSVLTVLFLSQSAFGQTRFLYRYYNQEYSPYYLGADVIDGTDYNHIYRFNKPFFLTHYRENFYHNILDSIITISGSSPRKYKIWNDPLNNLPIGFSQMYPDQNDSCSVSFFFDQDEMLDSIYIGNPIVTQRCSQDYYISYHRGVDFDSIASGYASGTLFYGHVKINKTNDEWTEFYSKNAPNSSFYDRYAKRVVDPATGDESIYLFNYDYNTGDSTKRFFRHYTHDKSIGKHTRMRYKSFSGSNVSYAQYEFYYDAIGRIDSGYFMGTDSNFVLHPPPNDDSYFHYKFHYHNDDVIPDSIVEYTAWQNTFSKVYFYKRKNKYYSVGEYEKLAKAVKVFPNPAKGYVTVECEGENIAGSRFYLIDLAGRKYGLKADTETDTRVKLNVQGFSPGVYILMVESENNRYTPQKLMLE